MRKFILVAALLLTSNLTFARARLQGYVEQGNTTLTIAGGVGNITRKVQGSFPGATVTIYATGTVNLATLYADNSGTPKANPFTSSADGSWYAYIDDGRYDVRFSGTGITTPFTVSDWSLFDGSYWSNKTLLGTANQITITTNPTNFTFSTPQNIATTSSPTFAALTITGATATLNGIQIDSGLRADLISATPGKGCALVNTAVCYRSSTSVDISPYSDHSTNLFIGVDSGIANTPLSTTQGRSNTFLGTSAGQNNTTGYASLSVGTSAGYKNTTGITNTNVGYQTGFNNEIGGNNVNIGVDAGAGNVADNNMFIGFHTGGDVSSGTITGEENVFIGNETAVTTSATTMHNNVGVGYRAGRNITTGYGNIFLGSLAGLSILDGYYNVIIGERAGTSMTSGYQNVAVGRFSGYNLTSGYDNSLLGLNAGFNLTTGFNNMLIGKDAGTALTDSTNNVYVGTRAGFSATSGYQNVGIGTYALFATTTGYINTAIGEESGYSLTTGNLNTFIGGNAGNNASQKVDAQNSTAIGYQAYTTADNQVVIGNANVTDTRLNGKVDSRSAQVSSLVTNSLGGYLRTFAEATGTPSGATTFFDISVNIPSGVKLLGCQLRVDTALTAGETWGAAYVTGSTTVLAAPGQAVAQNTKVNKMHVDEISSNTVNVRITRDAGSFTDGVGVIRAIVYYETFTTMGSL